MTGPARRISPELQLAGFLAKFTREIAAHAEDISPDSASVPHALELVYDNYNALAIGFGPTERASEAIISVAVFPRWVSLFFLQANGLPDPTVSSKARAMWSRHIVLPTPSALDEPAIQALIEEALNRAKVPLHPNTSHRVIIKSDLRQAKASPSRRKAPRSPQVSLVRGNPKPAHPPDKGRSHSQPGRGRWRSSSCRRGYRGAEP